MAAPPPPAPIPPDDVILTCIFSYILRNRSFPNLDGEHGMIDFVRNYLRSNVDPQLVSQRMSSLQVEYLVRRQMLERERGVRLELLPFQVQQRYALSQLVWSHCRFTDSDPSQDQTNQANSSTAAGIHHSDTHTSAAENAPEMSYSSTHQTNTNITVSPNPRTSRLTYQDLVRASSSTTKRQLFGKLNQPGGDGDTPAAPAAQDIHILTEMIAYSEVNNGVYPYVSAERMSNFVKIWLRSDADPGQIGKRIQELREMYVMYLVTNYNNDVGGKGKGKAVYSDSPVDILLLDLSNKLWQHEFGNPNDDSGFGKSSGYKS
ncbi:hypothetical protein ACH5RR_009435 [Cinchona calisaya]|uniref:Uncharacterized protein n=1 Tax=Cinchona calisaya TaxID=153742 RepID=A0ABD3AF10_9GENT